MAKKVVSFALHKTKKKPIKHSSSKGQNLKLMLNKIINYMKSDTYMFAPLVYPQSSLTSSPPSFAGEVSFEIEPIKKKEKRLVKDVENYLKCDCYMYAPLLMDSASDFATPFTGGNQVEETRMEEATGRSGNALSTLKDIGHDVSSTPATKIAVKHIRVHKETVKHVVHQNCRSSTVPEKLSSRKSSVKPW
ncbi:hypothetical protein BUALT_Bualt12G0070100 [Buddleja alternifolia]|uniref:Uncharacterized protein n=1 Tax=Buddleja alternifolia TaxID=168488 RepID=A0AAV6WN93_9LAMI|nr:hypothetical protein BUALT_Bualt12G0070100 [Buddleja alternifolia]